MSACPCRPPARLLTRAALPTPARCCRAPGDGEHTARHGTCTLLATRIPIGVYGVPVPQQLPSATATPSSTLPGTGEAAGPATLCDCYAVRHTDTQGTGTEAPTRAHAAESRDQRGWGAFAFAAATLRAPFDRALAALSSAGDRIMGTSRAARRQQQQSVGPPRTSAVGRRGHRQQQQQPGQQGQQQGSGFGSGSGYSTGVGGGRCTQLPTGGYYKSAGKAALPAVTKCDGTLTASGCEQLCADSEECRCWLLRKVWQGEKTGLSCKLRTQRL